MFENSQGTINDELLRDVRSLPIGDLVAETTDEGLDSALDLILSSLPEEEENLAAFGSSVGGA
ncbi:hypothetical protein [Catenuloplanes japonicus]|uniref:hypothetical protein n=1 Tax=Catenuloplanes japonicus TaxID=33876 RepID=UPI000526EC1E|nr:hypothetical protein [Catenuloplanes japonicus]